MRRLPGHTHPVLCLACSSDGRFLVSGGQDALRLWNLPGGEPVRASGAPPGGYRALAIAPDNKGVFTAGWESFVDLMSFETFATVTAWDRLSAEVWSLAVAPDGHALALGQGDGLIRVERYQSGSRPLLLRGHFWPVTGMAFTPDVRTLVSTGHDGTVRFWDAHWGQERQVIECGVWLTCSALSYSGRTLAVGTEDGRILLRSLPDNRERGGLIGHRGPVTRLAFTPDGARLLSTGEDGLVRVWEAEGGHLRVTYDWEVGALFALAVAPDGMTALAGGVGGTIVLFDLE
jgi:WD40 repeat protein